MAPRPGSCGTGACTADKVLPWLDQYAASWQEHRELACVDAHVHKRSSAETLERARWCLDVRQLRLSALTQELARVQGGVAQFLGSNMRVLDGPTTELSGARVRDCAPVFR